MQGTDIKWKGKRIPGGFRDEEDNEDLSVGGVGGIRDNWVDSGLMPFGYFIKKV